MKNFQNNPFIPILTSEAGCCLTVANWEEVGIHTVAYDLTALLMKPGLELLNTLPDLARYTAWQGNIVLNAIMPKMDKDEGYTLQSEYDGSRQRYTLDAILSLIVKLNPRFVLLPDGVYQNEKRAWQLLPDGIMPFFTPSDRPVQAARPFGVYFTYDATMSFSALLQQIQKQEGTPCYVDGELSLSMMRELACLGVEYIASDTPARDACNGLVYSHEGDISLKDDAYRLDFDVVDEKCDCPTCKQRLTRAYLHHLLEHTPLLCQRFLIQHNVYYCKT